MRLDLLLLEKGVVESRSRAASLIMAQQVKVNGLFETKPGAQISADAAIEILKPPPYVGRGGIKLEKALPTFQIDAAGKTCLDIGSSTGGFTDCLLQRGANKVYAVDVGRGQLAWKLRQDPRVIPRERCNARYLSNLEIPEPVDLCVMDVSFISVKKILPAVIPLMSRAGEFVILIKPQFEAGPQLVKKGIVKEKRIHEKVLLDFLEWFPAHRFLMKNLCYSPITGADGNVEFFFHLLISGTAAAAPPVSDRDVISVVEEAHHALGIPS